MSGPTTKEDGPVEPDPVSLIVAMVRALPEEEQQRVYKELWPDALSVFGVA
jgi:hypothetical protein